MLECYNQLLRDDLNDSHSQQKHSKIIIIKLVLIINWITFLALFYSFVTS